MLIPHDQMLKAIEEHGYTGLAYYKEGGGRLVFTAQSHKDIVIKYPGRIQNYHDAVEFGRAQSDTEIHFYNNVDKKLQYLLCPIVEVLHVYSLPVLVMRKAELIENDDYTNIINLIMHYTDEPIAFMQDLLELLQIHYVSDVLYNLKNWGLVDGKLKCIDYGLDEGTLYEDMEVLIKHVNQV